MRYFPVASFLVITAACDGGLAVNGQVLDGQGTPVAGATVSAYRDSPFFEATTDARGCFHMAHVVSARPHRAPFLVEAPGYKRYEGSIGAPDLDLRLTVRLVGNAAGGASEARLGSVAPECAPRRGK